MQIFAVMSTTAELALINTDPVADLEDTDRLHSSSCFSKAVFSPRSQIRTEITITKWGDALRIILKASGSNSQTKLDGL